MLVNPPPHLFHALSSMHHDICMHETKWKGKEQKLPQGGGSGGGRIGPRNMAQSSFLWVFRNPPKISEI